MSALPPTPPSQFSLEPDHLPAEQGRPIATAFAWVLIVGITLLVVVLNYLAPSSAADPHDDPLGVAIMKMQGRYLVGAAELNRDAAPAMAQQAEKTLNLGTIGQRFRAIVLMGELDGPDHALELLDELDQTLEDAGLELDEQEAEIRSTLGRLYEDLAAGQTSLPSLTHAERVQLVDELGWFGRLALVPPGDSDSALRRDVLRPAQRTVVVLLSGFGLIGVLGVGGFIALIIMIVLALNGSLRDGITDPISYGGIYAETFACWFVLFFGLTSLVGKVAPPDMQLLCTTGMFFLSLIALAWPVMRGIPWRQVRQDIGWTTGRAPALEPILGVGCYAMTLPLLAIGVIAVLFLMFASGMFQLTPGAGEDPFAPSGGPAHPVIQYLSGSSWWGRIQILAIASLAAPIVEETMFRGVLYRHLREASRGGGIVLSVLISSSISGFIFAVIHPQGLLAVPALMALAYGMTLAREWRGTLIPSMVLHAVSNGLVMILVMLLLAD